MSEVKPQEHSEEIQRRDDAQFQADMKQLLQEAEDTRIKFMQKHRSRSFISMTFGIISVLVGSAGFAWLLLVEYDLAKAVASIVLAILMPLMLNFWSHGPIKAYREQHKTTFMPKMARALGGFKFHSSRGISSKLIAKTGVIPSYKHYEAEDCFVGKYHGIKVIFSEARLYGNNKNQPPVFNGIFVVLETPSKVIDGHTIITADLNMVKQYANTRWKKMQTVGTESDDPDWKRFDVFSDQPEAAGLLIGERLQKEIVEAAATFDDAPMSVVLFREKFIFMSIPYEKDMFEASDMYVPVATKQHALDCKKEIEQILEIIDIFDLYKSGAEQNFSSSKDTAQNEDA